MDLVLSFPMLNSMLDDPSLPEEFPPVKALVDKLQSASTCTTCSPAKIRHAAALGFIAGIGETLKRHGPSPLVPLKRYMEKKLGYGIDRVVIYYQLKDDTTPRKMSF